MHSRGSPQPLVGRAHALSNRLVGVDPYAGCVRSDLEVRPRVPLARAPHGRTILGLRSATASPPPEALRPRTSDAGRGRIGSEERAGREGLLANQVRERGQPRPDPAPPAEFVAPTADRGPAPCQDGANWHETFGCRRRHRGTHQRNRYRSRPTPRADTLAPSMIRKPQEKRKPKPPQAERASCHAPAMVAPENDIGRTFQRIRRPMPASAASCEERWPCRPPAIRRVDDVQVGYSGEVAHASGCQLARRSDTDPGDLRRQPGSSGGPSSRRGPGSSRWPGPRAGHTRRSFGPRLIVADTNGGDRSLVSPGSGRLPIAHRNPRTSSVLRRWPEPAPGYPGLKLMAGDTASRQTVPPPSSRPALRCPGNSCTLWVE